MAVALMVPGQGKKKKTKKVERWTGGTVERWNGGKVEKWKGGKVAGTVCTVKKVKGEKGNKVQADVRGRRVQPVPQHVVEHVEHVV
jgi:hypothetical protein